MIGFLVMSFFFLARFENRVNRVIEGPFLNPKFEARISKQIRMTEIQMTETEKQLGHDEKERLCI